MNQKLLMAGATVALGGLATYYSGNNSRSQMTYAKAKTENEVVALIGDVGGTNVRLTLRKLNMGTRSSTEVKPLTIYDAQKSKSFEECVDKFLSVSFSSFSLLIRLV